MNLNIISQLWENTAFRNFPYKTFNKTDPVLQKFTDFTAFYRKRIIAINFK